MDSGLSSGEDSSDDCDEVVPEGFEDNQRINRVGRCRKYREHPTHNINA